MLSESSAAGFLFDNDGTLVDTVPLLYDITRKVLDLYPRSSARKEHADCSRDAVKVQVILEVSGHDLPYGGFQKAMMDNLDLSEFAQSIAAEHGCKLEGTEIDVKFRHCVVEAMMAPRKVFPIAPTVEIAKRAKERGQPIAIVTAAPKAWAWSMLGAAGLGELFADCVMVARDTPGLSRQKPHPDPYLLAAKLLNVPPEACLGYEDSDTGLEGLRQAGVQAVDARTLLGYNMKQARL